MSNQTIAAIATPPGQGGVGIIRISGSKAGEVAKNLCHKIPLPRKALYSNFYAADGAILDQGLALFFPAPHSFTGEDILELHGHGGPIILNTILSQILNLGVVRAQPGEFSQRAFLNGKLDLTQAEAIADLIAASSEQAARSAVGSLQGEFSNQINQLIDALIHLRVYVEASIDFPEEEINFLADEYIGTRLNELLKKIFFIQAQAKQGALLRDGMNVVITGAPNVGKSSLLNYLSGQDTAIVTDIPGTTRDVLRILIHLNGLPIHLLDTAGLRHSPDLIEQIGVRRAQEEIRKADCILLVIDSCKTTVSDPIKLLPELFPPIDSLNKIAVVANKIDLLGTKPSCQQTPEGYFVIQLSAKTGEGVNLLRQHLMGYLGFNPTITTPFSARQRHLDALTTAKQHLLRGQEQLQLFQAGELLAEELRLAQQALEEITGRFLPDELLGKIFASFCIGK